jgi:hypothetical protein
MARRETMIKNEREYRITRAQAAKFEEALVEADALPRASAPREARLQRLREDSLRVQLADLRAQLHEYEALRDGKMATIDVSSLADLPRALIQARLASRLSQKALAGRLALKEQQIQRYEATNYESASLGRLIGVANALAVKIYAQVMVPGVEEGIGLAEPAGHTHAKHGQPIPLV